LRRRKGCLCSPACIREGCLDGRQQISQAA
jgi:hypothetical protein